jgi:hypothetical protein
MDLRKNSLYNWWKDFKYKLEKNKERNFDKKFKWNFKKYDKC